MSTYDYRASGKIAAEGWPFYALIMAAMRQADTDNLEKLRTVYPNTWEELTTRYSALGGILPGESE